MPRVRRMGPDGVGAESASAGVGRVQQCPGAGELGLVDLAAGEALRSSASAPSMAWLRVPIRDVATPPRRATQKAPPSTAPQKTSIIEPIANHSPVPQPEFVHHIIELTSAVPARETPGHQTESVLIAAIGAGPKVLPG